MEDINLDEMDWMSLAPAGYVAPEGKEHVRLEVPAAPAPVSDTSCTDTEMSSITTSSIRGLCPSRVVTGLSFVNNQVVTEINDNPDNLKVVTLDEVRELTRNLVQWTPAELLATKRLEHGQMLEQHEQEVRASRKEMRQLQGKPAFKVHDDDCLRAFRITLDAIASGVKPNMKAIFRAEFGDNYKVVLDSHYLIDNRTKQSLTEKMLLRIQYHTVAKDIMSSNLPIAGKREYLRLKRGTVREALAGILRMHAMVIQWNAMQAQLLNHEQRIMTLEAKVATVTTQDNPKVVKTELELAKEQARQMYEDGMSYTAIGAALGRSKQAVRKWFN